MLRILGGSARGRVIAAVSGAKLRPTTSNIRAALFNHLGGRIEQARVLDLFAGSGAIGLEALSRGAREAVFIERHPASTRLLKSMLEREGWTDRAQVVCAEALRAIDRLRRAGAQFDWIYLDPPYQTNLADEALEALARTNLLAPGGSIVVEQRKGEVRRVPPAYRKVWERRHGDSLLVIFESSADPR